MSLSLASAVCARMSGAASDAAANAEVVFRNERRGMLEGITGQRCRITGEWEAGTGGRTQSRVKLGYYQMQAQKVAKGQGCRRFRRPIRGAFILHPGSAFAKNRG